MMGFWNFLFGNIFNSENAYEISPEASTVSNLYSQNGIFLDVENDTFKISYTGVLAKNGASDISVLVGYGNVNKWENVTSYAMKKGDNGRFEVSIPASYDTTINLAFNDNFNNWDNNLGQNYSFFC